MEIYQVGGAVRDTLMGRKPHDTDYVVVGATENEMLTAGYKHVNRDFPVFINPADGCEYALARREIKTGRRHTDFKFTASPDITLDEDLKRRDFTCNALARNLQTGQIIDCCNGIADIKNKTLRHISSKHFPEDPLRVLRMCRFAAQLDFTPAEETLCLAKRMTADGMLKHLPPERIWQEIYKALQSSCFEKFIITAQACGALKSFLPELDRILPSDKGSIITCLKLAGGQNAKIKFAVLLQNIILHNQSEDISLIKNICSRLRIPHEFEEFSLLCVRNIPSFGNTTQMTPEDLADFITGLSKKRATDIEDFINAASVIFANEPSCAENANLIRRAARILQNIKAENMPDFARLPKNKSFAEAYRKFRINILRTRLHL